MDQFVCLSLGRVDGGKQKTTDKVKWQLDQLTIYIHTLTQGEDYTTLLFIIFYMRIHYLIILKRSGKEIQNVNNLESTSQKELQVSGSKSQISDVIKVLFANG